VSDSGIHLLADLAFLVGDWGMAVGGASCLPDPEHVVHARVGVRWIEGGGLLAMHQGEAPPPRAPTWIVDRREASRDSSLLSSDDRGVARIGAISEKAAVWRIGRNHAESSHRFQATVSDDRNAIVCRWERRLGQKAGEDALDVAHTRLA